MARPMEILFIIMSVIYNSFRSSAGPVRFVNVFQCSSSLFRFLNPEVSHVAVTIVHHLHTTVLGKLPKVKSETRCSSVQWHTPLLWWFSGFGYLFINTDAYYY